MLDWAAVFFLIALVVGILGFGGIAGGAVEIAKIPFFLFGSVFLLSPVMGLLRRK